MTAHVHAALMAEYAMDAMETDKPWERWETGKEDYRWKNLLQHPDWNIHNLYRRKQKTKTVYQWIYKNNGKWYVSGALASNESEWHEHMKMPVCKPIRLDYTAMEVPC